MGLSRQRGPRRLTLFPTPPSSSLQAWGLTEVPGDHPLKTPEQLGFMSASASVGARGSAQLPCLGARWRVLEAHPDMDPV